MAEVLFEPIGEAIACDAEDTVLNAAFAAGLGLVHGCREGQCSACKAYLLEGEVTLRRHSSFALSEVEEEQGYTLLCRAMPDSDLVVELLHVDEDYRLEHPICDGRAEVLEIEAVALDVRRLRARVIEPTSFGFRAGQYVDLHVPGSAGEERRAYSMACAGPVLDFYVRRYPDGHFSGLLDGSLAPGDELDFTGPYGSFHLRPGSGPIVMVAGGTGLAPMLALLDELAGSERPVRLFHGVRTAADLFAADAIATLGRALPDFAFVPVLSEENWDGACGLVTDTVADALAGGGFDDADIYLCGPPPMVDAATDLAGERRVFADRFTTAATEVSA